MCVVRRKRAHKYEWSVSFLCRISAQEKAALYPRNICAIDVGWRKMPSGSLRVATLVSSTNLTPAYIELPIRAVECKERSEQLTSERKDSANALLTELRKLDWSTAPDSLKEAATSINHPYAGARFLHRLIYCWRMHSEWQSELFPAYSAWLSKDKKLREEEVNCLRRVTNVRKNTFQELAKALVRAYDCIGLEKLDVKGMAAVKNKDGSTNQVAKISGRNRTVAAPGELQATIKWAAKRDGKLIHIHTKENGKAERSSFVCPEDGTFHVPNDPQVQHWRCSHCKQRWDRDEAAARVILKATVVAQRALNSALAGLPTMQSDQECDNLDAAAWVVTPRGGSK